MSATAPTDDEVIAAFKRRTIHDATTLATYLAHPDADESWLPVWSDKPKPSKAEIVSAGRSLRRLLSRGQLEWDGGDPNSRWMRRPSPYKSALECMRAVEAEMRVEKTSNPLPRQETPTVSLATHQKQVIENLVARCPSDIISQILRSVGSDLEPNDYRGAILDEAARRLDKISRTSLMATLGGDTSEQTEEDDRRDALLSEVPEFDETRFIKCPVEDCQCEQVHPSRLLINKGGVITRITSRGVVHYQSKPAGDGVLIAIEFQCEAGHVIHQKMHFSHGTTWTGVAHVETFNPEEDRSGPIWRS